MYSGQHCLTVFTDVIDSTLQPRILPLEEQETIDLLNSFPVLLVYD